jgi:hypothetical protein
VSDLPWLFGRDRSDNQTVFKEALPLMDFHRSIPT